MHCAALRRASESSDIVTKEPTRFEFTPDENAIAVGQERRRTGSRLLADIKQQLGDGKNAASFCGSCDR